MAHSPTAAGPTAGRPARPLVGRAREVECVNRCLDAVADGRGGALLIAGEAGIGKTRLAEHAATRAAELGIPTVWGRCVFEEGVPPFWPWRQVLGDSAAAAGAVEVRALASLLPEAGGAGRGFGGEARFELFEEAGAALARAAEPRGLVVVIDDLHWADPSSTALLAHVARGLSRSRILLMVTYRDQEIGAEQAAAVAALAREPGTDHVSLSGLAEVDIADQLEATFGRRFDPGVVTGIARRSQGNPFFAAELARMLEQPDRDDGQEDGRPVLPESVRAVTTRRLDMLPPAARQLVAVASLLGSDVDATLLAGVSGASVEDVLDLLGAAVSRSILVRQARGGAFRFTHDLVRETAQSELGAAERARLHLRCAEVLDTDGVADPARVAYHRLSALPLGDPGAALDVSVRAAQAAFAQLAFEDAGRLYDAALAALSSSLVAEERMRLLLAAAGAHRLANDVEATTLCCEELAALAMRCGDMERLAQAALALEGVVGFPRHTSVGSWCAAALKALGDDDTPTRARVLAQLANADLLSGNEDAALEASAEALAMADRLADVQSQMSALRSRQMARSGPEGCDERLMLGGRMLELAARADQPEAAMWGHLWRFDAMMQTGRLNDAEGELERLGRVVDWRRVPLARWHLARSRAAVDLARGRFAAALEAERPEGVNAFGFKTVHMWVSIYTGDEMGLTPTMDDLRLVDRPESWVKLALAAATLWNLAFERPDEAAALYERAAAMPGGWRPVPFGLLLVAAFRCEAAAALGDAVGAADAYEVLLPYRHLQITGGAGVIFTRGSSELPLGQAAAMLGETSAAIAHLRAAVDVNQATGLVALAAESQHQLARVLVGRRRAGDADEALRLATTSEAAALRLGMAPLVARNQRLLGALRGGTTPLTPREVQVAELVAEGRTNREIAVLAHISERTAENHVQHILVKLGFANRAQIAAWVARQRQALD